MLLYHYFELHSRENKLTIFRMEGLLIDWGINDQLRTESTGYFFMALHKKHHALVSKKHQLRICYRTGNLSYRGLWCIFEVGLGEPNGRWIVDDRVSFEYLVPPEAAKSKRIYLIAKVSPPVKRFMLSF